jgi:hypothetical protein
MQIAGKDTPAHWIDRGQALMSTFVVLGPGHTHAIAGNRAGRIKHVRFGPCTASPLLEVEWITKDNRRIGCKGLRLVAEERAKGTVFLRDLYEAEGRLADYEKYVAREATIMRGGIVEVLSEHDSRLPAKVVEWRRGVGAQDVFVWDAPAEEVPTVSAVAEKPTQRRRVAVNDAPPAGGTDAS